MRIRIRLAGGTLAIVLCLMTGRADGAVIWDNLVSLPINGALVCASFACADDFSVARERPISGATLELYGVISWDGQGEWAIFSDAGGGPGLVLDHGLAENYAFGPSEYNFGTTYRFDFGTDFLASPGETYWFAFHQVSDGQGGWRSQEESRRSPSVRAAVTADQVAFDDVSSFGAWEFPSAGRDFVFQLEGLAVPEPGTGVLVALGLAGLAASRRRVRATGAAR